VATNKALLTDQLPDMTEKGFEPTTGLLVGEAYVLTHKNMIKMEMEFIIA
jgi:hypothetical protein